MSVDAVVGDVELATDEPLGDRGLGPVEDLVERGVPGQPVGLLRPERQAILLGLAVQLGGRVRLRGEVVGWWIPGWPFGVGLRHDCEPSHLARCSNVALGCPQFSTWSHAVALPEWHRTLWP